MLVWSTQFLILPNRTTDDLLALCKKWLIGSPHNNEWIAAEIPEAVNDEITTALKGIHTIALIKTTFENENFCGFRHQWQDEDHRDWATEICGWCTSSHFLVGIHLHCSTTDTGIPLPRPNKPYIVRQILEEMGGDIDGDFQVCDEPRILAESEVDVAARLLLGETNHYLPVIYTSSTFNNCPPFDVLRLAQWASGMAHVVVEPSRQFSKVLASRVERTNPHSGAVSIYWPHGSGRTSKFFPYDSNSAKYASAVAETIRNALTVRRSDYHCNWDYLRELAIRKKIESLRRKGKASIEEYIKAFDGELKLTKSRLEESEIEIRRLKAELISRVRGFRINSDGLLKLGSEQDLFPGEQKDILFRALTIASHNVQPDGRVQDVLNALIKANLPTGESERIEQNIRDILANCMDAGKKERRALEELGFTISEDGKHLKLVFRGDDRYTFTLSKTASDWRGMKNTVSDITKRLFK
jgi:hypothetical protein